VSSVSHTASLPSGLHAGYANRPRAPYVAQLALVPGPLDPIGTNSTRLTRADSCHIGGGTGTHGAVGRPSSRKAINPVQAPRCATRLRLKRPAEIIPAAPVRSATPGCLTDNDFRVAPKATMVNEANELLVHAASARGRAEDLTATHRDAVEALIELESAKHRSQVVTLWRKGRDRPVAVPRFHRTE
jgi:hypothetical protein